MVWVANPAERLLPRYSRYASLEFLRAPMDMRDFQATPKGLILAVFAVATITHLCLLSLRLAFKDFFGLFLKTHSS